MGKEYLNSNNFVYLRDNSKEKEKALDNKKTISKKVKKIAKSKETEDIDIEAKINFKDQSTIKTNANEEVVLSDKKDEIELTDDINNARKKRRRSSASIE